MLERTIFTFLFGSMTIIGIRSSWPLCCFQDPKIFYWCYFCKVKSNLPPVFSVQKIVPKGREAGRKSGLIQLMSRLSISFLTLIFIFSRNWVVCILYDNLQLSVALLLFQFLRKRSSLFSRDRDFGVRSFTVVWLGVLFIQVNHCQLSWCFLLRWQLRCVFSLSFNNNNINNFLSLRLTKLFLLAKQCVNSLNLVPKCFSTNSHGKCCVLASTFFF